MVTIKLQFKKLSTTAIMPTRGSASAAGYDLYSTEDYTLKPLERKLFKTGISMAIPQGLYGRIAPRSGLAYKDGIDTMAGVIDEDYRGDVGVILINLGQADKSIKAGDKIAQIIFEHYNAMTFEEVAELATTIRAEGGFGSTDAPKSMESTVKGTLEAFKTIVEHPVVARTITDLYQQSGGVPVKKRYSEEIKDRQATQ